jgi:hypothetical protein
MDYPGLTFDIDKRKDPGDDDNRFGNFKAGWRAAVNGDEYVQVLDNLTWQNLGWRLGKLLGDVDEFENADERYREMFEWCVEQWRSGAKT